MSLHIGILQTDNVLPDFVEDHGDYPQMFRELLWNVDEALRFTDYDVQTAVPGELDCDVYLITGSRHSVYDELPWIEVLVDFLRTALQAQKKVVGICFGHQLMAHYFGGRVGPADAGWAVGVHASEVVRREAWMREHAHEVALLSSHKDQVLELPANAELLLTNAFCPIAGFTMGDQVITVQGHPEFKKPYAEALMDMREAQLGSAVYQQGIESLAEPTEEAQVARWLLDFVAARV